MSTLKPVKNYHTIDDTDMTREEKKVARSVRGMSVTDALTALHVVIIKVALSVADAQSVAALFRNIAEEIENHSFEERRLQ